MTGDKRMFVTLTSKVSTDDCCNSLQFSAISSRGEPRVTESKGIIYELLRNYSVEMLLCLLGKLDRHRRSAARQPT